MFALWELAKNFLVQESHWAEIIETLRKIRTSGDSGFTAKDFDAMP